MKRRIEPFEAPRIGSRVELINGTWFWIDGQPEPPEHLKESIKNLDTYGNHIPERSYFTTDGIDQPEPDNDRCPSCGVPYTEHLGLIGTCKRVQELSVYKSLLSSAHGALADCGLPVPGLDQDIAPVIRKLTEERDQLQRLYDHRGKALERPCSKCGYKPLKFTTGQNDFPKQEGVIE
jgi:hypothetical protein